MLYYIQDRPIWINKYVWARWLLHNLYNRLFYFISNIRKHFTSEARAYMDINSKQICGAYMKILGLQVRQCEWALKVKNESWNESIEEHASMSCSVSFSIQLKYRPQEGDVMYCTQTRYTCIDPSTFLAINATASSCKPLLRLLYGPVSMVMANICYIDLSYWDL